MRQILIGGAWPYANGSLHIGHIAGLLPGDVLARYHRAIGDKVYFVSGSDCHGTPVAIRAKQENKTPQEVSDFYHREVCKMRQILIGGAWPYANGSLHIGHIAGLLPGDVLARYHRAIGDKVYFVSGSDCHGTPVAIRAKQENKTPQEVSDFYHREFAECFERLGFSYDAYIKTSANEHKDFVRDFHRKLYESPYVYEKEVRIR